MSDITLVPVTEFDSPYMEFDFHGLKIDFAEYAEGTTGMLIILI